MTHRPRIILAHDWLCGLRGGELVLDALSRLLPTMGEVVGLYTMFDDGRPLTPAIDVLAKTVSTLGRMPLASTSLRRWLLPLYPSAVEELSRRLGLEHERSPIDLVVSTSSAAMKGLRPPMGVPHLCYIHTPARYLWSQGHEYAKESRARALGLAAFGPALRRWDRATASNVTRFIANSHHTAALTASCYGIRRDKVYVVHPPIRTDVFTPPPPLTPREDFWLLVSALEPYKRIDLAIEAAALARARLVIAGSGSHEPHLRRHAAAFPAARIEFLGRVGEARLQELFQTARLFVHPQVEDFGMTAVEAQASGLPVVAFARGGALDTVRDGITGALFRTQSPESLAEAARRCPKSADQTCRTNALRFTEANFDRAISQHIREMLGLPPSLVPSA